MDAREDLDAIYDYIRQHSQAAAETQINALHRAFQTIASNPDIGRRYENRLPGLQVLVSGKYHNFYRVVKDEAQIKQVIHGARDLAKVIFR